MLYHNHFFNFQRIEELVQPYAAQVTLAMRIVECFIPAFCGLFAGSWADRYGRKPLLMGSFLGGSGPLLII